jgi:amino acid transporter
LTHIASKPGRRNEHRHGESQLGSILCWAVVFADIGTSVYYVPGILYRNIGSLAGFFVFLTMSVFVLLVLKYAEVTHRFPQGGGVVTVAAQAMNHWVGALGGMFILVDYFLTAAISCLSGILYLSVVFPAMGPFAVGITIGTLVLLGLLNWIGVSASAKVSLVGAVIAFFSDIAILVSVFLHISFSEFLALFPRMFASHALTPVSILIGFSGSFLAFSGLESISQLSPVMKTPRKKVGGIALLLVVITVGLTSPLLTMLSTLLLPSHVLADPVLSAQVVSLLGGNFGSIALQTEVAISASALLVFASNTAIIGTYHVFIALSRMQFFPAFILKRNKLRGTPHYSILLATAIPIAVLLLVNGDITILGDMYAFGLLGAFTLTCLGLDIVRHRERKAARHHSSSASVPPQNGKGLAPASSAANGTTRLTLEKPSAQEHISSDEHATTSDPLTQESPPSPYAGGMMLNPWYTFKFYIGLLTTALVFTAWTTNLVAKPLATAFGGTITVLGMGIASFNYARKRREGYIPVVITHVEELLPGSTLAVLTPEREHNEAVTYSAIHNADGKPVVFLYLSSDDTRRVPHLFEYHNPYYDDQHAQEAFGRAEYLAQKFKAARWFLYQQREPDTIEHVWKKVHPRDIVVAAENVSQIQDINPDSIRYEVTPHGKAAHLLKNW